MIKQASFLFAMSLAAVACASDVGSTGGNQLAEIPLSEIWAMTMPGTKKLSELEPKKEGLEELSREERIKSSLVRHTAWGLNANFRAPHGSVAKPGFVVKGSGLDALREAHDVILGDAQSKKILPTEQDLTLVFFSYSCSRDVVLDSVELKNNEIVVKYHFYWHNLRRSRENLALIPLGSLPAGKYRVTYERTADQGREENGEVIPLSNELARRTICDSFSFGVAKSKQ